MKRFLIAILLITLGATSTLGAEATLEKISKDGVPIEIDSDSMELRGRDNLVISEAIPSRNFGARRCRRWLI